MNLTLDHWKRMTATERERVAKRLAKELPTGFAFRSVTPYAQGDQQQEVALFDFHDSVFALIPGGPVTLGYNADRRWTPTAEERESWDETAQEYEFDQTLEEQIAAATLRPRQVPLTAFLIETNAAEVGWLPIPESDIEVQEILREYRTGTSRHSRVEVVHEYTSTRVSWTEDNKITAERSFAGTHATLTEQLRRNGFRFPTSDEWEYACGSGADTLFRWGDHVPCDRYPTDISPAEAAWRRKWVLSGGTLAPPPDGFPNTWDLHRQPNAFGLTIAVNPYHSELVAEPGITRGGDGGCTICGGAGFFLGWLTLATAYFEDHSCKYDPSEPVSVGYTVARRVLSLE